MERSLVTDIDAASFNYVRNVTCFRVYKETLFIGYTVLLFIHLNKLIADFSLL
jgi:hypothetical protein